jgi:hypothetical protein
MENGLRKRLGKRDAVLAMIAVVTFFAPAGLANAQTNYEALVSDLRQAKAALDRRVPERLDKRTIITAVRVEGRTMVYVHTIEEDKAKLPANIADQIKKNILKAGCKSDDFKLSMSLGAHFRYEYFDKNGQPLPSILVTAKDCGVADGSSGSSYNPADPWSAVRH